VTVSKNMFLLNRQFNLVLVLRQILPNSATFAKGKEAEVRSTSSKRPHGFKEDNTELKSILVYCISPAKNRKSRYG